MQSSKRHQLGAQKSSNAKHYWCPHQDKIWAVGELQSEGVKSNTIKLFVKEDDAISDFSEDTCIFIEDNSYISEEVDDLTSLSQVNDATILNCSRIRFNKSIIYTSIGTVLMAINPFERISGLYGKEAIAKYHWNNRDSNVAPHIYLTPAAAYKAMSSFGRNQSLIISGESGAGKTEATKQCLDYLTKVSTGKKINLSENGENHDDISEIAQRIIAASPILEAFGNAQTVRNPNSSRFGKWMELSFDKHNVVRGSRIISYLLEKSRVSQHDPHERNYHLFYQLVRGADAALLKTLNLCSSTREYAYLCKDLPNEGKDFNDADNFKEVMHAFDTMGFDEAAVVEAFKLVASVLLLGNIEFESIDDDEASRINDTNSVSKNSISSASMLLGVEEHALGMAMCTRTIQSGGLRKSITTVRLNQQKASDTRDSLARCIYDKLFLDVIKKINSSSQAVGQEDGASYKLIGLLDIFGFEIFEINSFEQLCINYCNEKLQNHFTTVIFVAELEMYEAEEIACESIEFKDNVNVIKLIESSFKLLDEESKIPRGSSKTWFDKLKKANNSNSLEKKKSSKNVASSEPSEESLMKFPPSRDAFVISHYAGPVSYLPENFMEKNTEILSNDLVNTMLLSENSLVKQLFTPDVDESASSPVKNGSRGRNAGKPSTCSLSKSFQNQLQSLMTLLQSTDSHFVKCIKSNSKCRPKEFEASLIHRQLLYSGVFEVVKIQQSGLPARLPHAVFSDRYRCLLPMDIRWNEADGRASIGKDLQSIYEEEIPQLQIGRTKTFMKGKELRFLENLKADVEDKAALSIQHWMLGRVVYLAVQNFRNLLSVFAKFLEGLKLDEAESHAIVLGSKASRISKITISGALDHITRRSQDQLRVLKLQLSILETIGGILSSEDKGVLSEEEFESLSPVLDDAKSIGFRDAAVARAEELVKRFHLAKKSIEDMNSFADENTSEEENSGSTPNEYDSVTLSAIVKSLADYSGILPGASLALSTAKSKLDEIKIEMDEYIPMLADGLRSLQNVTFDEISGDIQEGSDARPLKEALDRIKFENLKGSDCKTLYNACSSIIDIKTDCISHKAQGATEKISSLSAVIEKAISLYEEEPKYFEDIQRLLGLFSKWADDRLFREAMLSALLDCRISEEDGNLTEESDEDLDAIFFELNSLNSDRAASKASRQLVDLSKQAVKLRRLFYKRQWSEVKDFMSSYALDIQCPSIEPKFLEEMHNEKHFVLKVAEFFLLRSRLLELCKKKVFCNVDIDHLHDSMASLLQDAFQKDERSAISSAKLVDKSFTDDFVNLLDLSEMCQKLRGEMCAGNYKSCRDLIASIKHHQLFSSIPHLDTEVRYCIQLIDVIDKENLLIERLAKDKISWQLVTDSNSRENVMIFSSKSLNDISQLRKICEEIQALRRLPKRLLQKAQDVEKYLAEARTISFSIYQEDLKHKDPKSSFSVSSTSNFSNVAASMKLVQEALKLESLRDNRTELEILLLELQRRRLKFEISSIIKDSIVVFGTIGDLKTNNEQCANAYDKMIDIKQEMGKLQSDIRSNDAAYSALLTSDVPSRGAIARDKFYFERIFLSDILLSMECAEELMVMRQAVVRNDWSTIDKCLEKWNGADNESAQSKVANLIMSSDEYTLVQKESGHRKLIKSLQDAVGNIDARFDVDSDSDVLTFIPDSEKIELLKLENAVNDADRIGCHSPMCKLLYNTAKRLLGMLAMLKENKTSDVSCAELMSLYDTMTSELHVDGIKISAILLHVKVCQVIENFVHVATSTQSHQTREIYASIKSCTGNSVNDISRICPALTSVLEPWVQRMEFLRQLRLLVSNEDWLSVIDFVNYASSDEYQFSAKNRCSEAEMKLQEYLQNERSFAFGHAKAKEASARVSVASEVGKIGSTGISTLYIPELGIGMLRDMLDKTTADCEGEKALPEILQQRDHLSSLLTLRESVYKESHVYDEEKSKARKESLIWGQTSGVLAARGKTKSAVEKSCDLFKEECSVVSETSALQQLIELLEREMGKPVAVWTKSTDSDSVFTEAGQVDINSANLSKQKKAVEEIQRAYPEKYLDIPLVKLSLTLHDLLSTAEHIDDYSVLEERLKELSLLTKTSNISSDIRNCIEKQMSAFQKGNLMDQLNTLVYEGLQILDSHCKLVSVFNNYLDSVNSMIVKVGSGNVPTEVQSCFDSMRKCRDLCISSEFYLQSEFSKHKEQLEVVSGQAPQWFYDKLSHWVGKLPDPNDMPTIAIAKSLRREGPAEENVVFLNSSSASLCLQNVSNYVQLMVKAKSLLACKESSSVENYFDRLCDSFTAWKYRYCLLNLIWRGVQCVEARLQAADFHCSSISEALLTSHMPSAHTDTHTLQEICALLKDRSFDGASGALKILALKAANNFQNVIDSLVNVLNLKEERDKSQTSSSSSIDLRNKYLRSAVSLCATYSDALVTVCDILDNLEHLAGLQWDITMNISDGSQISLRYEVQSSSVLNISYYWETKNWELFLECSSSFLRELQSVDTATYILNTALKEISKSRKERKGSLYRSHFASQSSYQYLLHAAEADGNISINIFNSLSDSFICIKCHLNVLEAVCLDNSSFIEILTVSATELSQKWNDGIEPSMSAEIQDSLGSNNAGCGNVELKKLIAQAREAIYSQKMSIDYYSQLMLTSQSDFNVSNVSPWVLQWMQLSKSRNEMLSNDIDIQKFPLLQRILDGRSYLSSQLKALSGQEDCTDIMLIAMQDSIIEASGSNDEIKKWICSVHNDQNDLFKFNLRVAMSSIDRLFPSRGVLKKFIALFRSFVNHCSLSLNHFLFSHHANKSDSTEFSTSVRNSFIEFISAGSSSALHPMLNEVLLSCKELYFISNIMNSLIKSRSSDAIGLLRQNSHMVNSFCKSMSNIGMAIRGRDEFPKFGALDLIHEFETLSEELVSKLEGLHRLNSLYIECIFAAMNRKTTSLRNEKTKRKDGDLSEMTRDILSAPFRNQCSDNDKRDKFLKPALSESCLQFAIHDREAMELLFRLRALAQNKAVKNAADSSTKDTERAERMLMKKESELLIPLSPIITTKVTDKHLRCHLLQEIGVVSLRNSKSDLDDKIGELILLIKLCGCDLRALQVGLHKRRLFDVPAFDDSSSEASSAVSATDGKAGKKDSSASKMASQYMNFLDLLDSICNCFLKNSDDYLHVETLPALSRGELGKRVGMLYMDANFLGSLGKPTTDLYPPKIAQPKANASKYDSEDSAPHFNKRAPIASSPVHLLASRLMFMGYFKSHMTEILQKVQSGSMSPLGKFRSDECTSSTGNVFDDEPLNACGNAMPEVPLSHEGFQWQSFDEDSVDVRKNDISGRELASRLRRSSSSTRVRNAALSNPHYDIDGFKRFFIDLKNIFNKFLSVRRDYYQNLGPCILDNSAAFLSDLEDFSSKYYLEELTELMAEAESIVQHAPQDDTAISGEDDKDCEGSNYVFAAKHKFVFSPKTILTHLSSNKDFNDQVESNVSDLSVMTCLCLPEWICHRQDLLSAYMRMKNETKQIMQKTMIKEYNKNLSHALDKHNGIFREVVQSSYDSNSKPTLLVAAIASAASSGHKNAWDDSSLHKTFQEWFFDRFGCEDISEEVPLDRLKEELRKENVFDSEESMNLFLGSLDVEELGALTCNDFIGRAFHQSSNTNSFVEFVSNLRDDEAPVVPSLDESSEVHKIHAEFLKFYSQIVIAEVPLLESLLQSFPELEMSDLPSCTKDLIDRVTLILEIRKSIEEGALSDVEQALSFEGKLSKWFDRFPDTDDQAGSLEVKSIFIAAKNRIFQMLFESKVLSALQPKGTSSAKMFDDNKEFSDDDDAAIDGLILDEQESFRFYDKVFTDQRITTSAMHDVISSMFGEKPFACSEISLARMNEALLINDLHLMRDNDIWNSFTESFERKLCSDLQSVQELFESYLYEGRLRNCFLSVAKELHDTGVFELSHLRLANEREFLPKSDSVDGGDNESSETVADSSCGASRNASSGSPVEAFMNASATRVNLISSTGHEIIRLPPPSDASQRSMFILYDLLRSSADRNGSHIDKRALMLYQLLVYFLSRPLSYDVRPDFKIIARASEWFTIPRDKWDSIFSFSQSISRSLYQPLSAFRSIVTLERRRNIQMWQHHMFFSTCSSIRAQTSVVIPDIEADDFDGDEEAKAAAKRMEEMVEFNLVDRGKTTTIRMMELNEVLSLNLKRILKPFAELYRIFSVCDYEHMHASMTEGEVDRLKFILNADPDSRFVQDSLRVFNWVLAGLPSDKVSLESPKISDDDSGNEQAVEGNDPSKNSEATPPTPLDLLSIAMHCSIPPDVRMQLLFCRLHCINEVNKKFLIKELSRAADGELREYLGRQQVFTDLSKAFTELSFILVEMENRELFSEDELSVIDNSTDMKKDEAGIFDEHGESSISKRASISETIQDFKDITSDLTRAGHWILRLEMTILTEDWEKMESMIKDHETHPIIVRECPEAIPSFISLGRDIRAHNECLDKIEEYLFFNVAKHSKGKSSSAMPSHDARPFFYFVNFPALERLVRKTKSSTLTKSSELEEKLSICEFLIKVKAAIVAEKWFENEDQNNKFVADMLLTRPQAIAPSMYPATDVGRQVEKLEKELREKGVKPPKSKPSDEVVCVSVLLKNSKPKNLPRLVSTEIQRIEREFQNQQIEICLIDALMHGQEYLKNNDLSLIHVGELEEVCDIASGMTQRSQRTTMLLDSAQKVMNLRRCLRAADWSGVRCWLGEPSEVAPEAFMEIDAIEKLSTTNYEMHSMLNEAMQSNCIGGTHMKLDTSNTNISLLLVAIRNAAHVPKLSPEDRQICYTAERLKSVRLSILMSDYDTLIAEISSLDLKQVSACALDEFLLVKKAIGFFESMNKLKICLRSNGPRGYVGNIDAQNISIYRLGSAIGAVDFKICSESIQSYLSHASVMKDIRSAVKGGRFGISSLVECFVLECIDESQRPPNSQPKLEHSPKRLRKMSYGREILGGVYINDSVLQDMNLEASSEGDNDQREGMAALLHFGSSGEAEQWKNRAFKDEDNIAAVKTPYEDVPGREFHLSSLLESPLLRRKDPDSVAAKLGELGPHVLSDSESEIILIRNELYNRVGLNVLNRGLIRADKSSRHESTRFKGMDVDMSPIQIEHAIFIVQHLGIKTEAAFKLYHTALVIRKLRYFSKDLHRSNKHVGKVMEALGQVKSLKSNNLFASIATAEIENVFNLVCGKTIRHELISALDKCLPRVADSHTAALDHVPFSSDSVTNDSDSQRIKDGTDDLTKIITLRKALRAAAVNGEQKDAETKLLREMCQVLHSIMSAKNSGIHAKMMASYDSADKLFATVEQMWLDGKRMRDLDKMFSSGEKTKDEMDEIDFFSLSKRLTKEVSNQRRNCMEIRFASASSSSDNPLHLARARRHSASISRDSCATNLPWEDMNSYQRYEAIGDTTAISEKEKEELISTSMRRSNESNQNADNNNGFFPPFFHGTGARAAAVTAADKEANCEAKLVSMIRKVMDAHIAASKPSQFYSSPSHKKLERQHMNANVKVDTRGKFKLHLQVITSDTKGVYSAVQKVAAAFLLSFLKYPHVKENGSESSTTISKKLLESSIELLNRNDNESFIQGARSGDADVHSTNANVQTALRRLSVSTVRRGSIAPGEGLCPTGSIKEKSKSSFEMALKIGGFVELGLHHLTCNYTSCPWNQTLAEKRLKFLRSYFEKDISACSPHPVFRQILTKICAAQQSMRDLHASE